MKKLFMICAMLLFATLAGYSQSNNELYTYKATSFQSQAEGYDWTEWKTVDILIKLYPNKKRIDIFSATPQYIDYGALTTEELDDRTTYSGLATDTQYRTIKIRLVIWNDGDIILTIEYSDLKLRYFMKSYGVDTSNYM